MLRIFLSSMEHIPKIDSIIEEANLPDNPHDPLTYQTQERIYKALIRYYNQFTDISPLKYTFTDNSSGEEIHQIQTTLYKPESQDLNNYNDTGIHYTNYSEKALTSIGINTENIWNGDSCIVTCDGETLNFGYTDYYTSTILSRSLFIETANALEQAQNDLDKISKKSFPLRNKMLNNIHNIRNTPAFCTGAASGGVIIGKHNDEWVLLLGRRSDKPRVNKGLLSVIPNGGVEYSDYNGSETFLDTTRRELVEELPVMNDEIPDQQIDIEHSITGWNLRHGGLAAGHSIYLDTELLDKVLEQRMSNFEFSELVRVPILEPESIKDHLEFGDISPSVVPMIAQTLINFDKKEHTPELPYHISTERD
jgi:hypothetical protein